MSTVRRFERKRLPAAVSAYSARSSIRPFAPSPVFEQTSSPIPASLKHVSHSGHSLDRISISSPAIQRKYQQQGNQAPPPLQEDNQLRSRIHAARGSGLSLNKRVREQLEQGLGADLSHVRIHTGNEADSLSRSVQALAFTTGPDIFFRAGRYQPGSSQGFHLLAHEVMHILQQAAGPVAGKPYAGGISVSDPDDRFEQAAEISAASQGRHSSSEQTRHHFGQYTIFSPQRELNQPASLSPLTAMQHSFPGNSNIVLQRALAAQSSLAPASTGSVPDLPSALVTKLTNACLPTATDQEREDVLKDIYDELQPKGIIDNVDRNDFIYGGQDPDTYGITDPIDNTSSPPPNKVRVIIYSAAFNGGAATVYSTIRHELIHAEQYRNVPSATPASDPFFYAERGKGADKKVLRGQGSEAALIVVLSEIETYSWEIAHASETGVEKEHRAGIKLPGKQQTFKEQRTDELMTLYGNLIRYSDELSYPKQVKWREYILRAKTLAETTLGLASAQQRNIAWKAAPAQGTPTTTRKGNLPKPGSIPIQRPSTKTTKARLPTKQGRKKRP